VHDSTENSVLSEQAIFCLRSALPIAFGADAQTGIAPTYKQLGFFTQTLQTVKKIAAIPFKVLKFTEGMLITCATPYLKTVPVF